MEPEITRREALQMSRDLSALPEQPGPTPYALNVVFELRSAESAEAFDALVAETLEGIADEPDTLVYAVHTPEGQPLVRVFYELYADERAFLSHEGQPHVRRMVEERARHLVGAPQVLFMHQHMGKLPRGPV
ncbi:antibiotic biosynthesis monooxygenase [Streptomyces sp. HUAS MG91]|uniref:Antibiotic biosynthesis monooxygenase n=1 Tax=Streptomyces tabacisoli TaxID=3156398 RepID=A0AAU8J5Q7_9ACTN